MNTLPNADRAGTKEAILVLGMHRSGISALTGTLALLGAAKPRTLTEAAASDEAGYFESTEITRLNSDILASGGSAWNDWREFNPNWIHSAVARQFHDRALSVISGEFDGAPLIAVKDPRICRIVPFWERVLSDAGYRHRNLLFVRNPLEVAQSLRHRDGSSIAEGLLIWLRHVLDAEHQSRGPTRRAVLLLSDMLDDWQGALVRCGAQLDVVWPRQSDQAADEIDRFYSAELYRSIVDDASLRVRPNVHEWAVAAYEALKLLAVEPGANSARETLDTVRADFNQASKLYGPAFTFLEVENRRLGLKAQALSSERDLAHVEAGAKEEHLAHLQAQLDAAVAQAGAKEEHLARLQTQLDAAAAEAGAKEEYLAHLQARLDAAAAEAGAKEEYLAHLQARLDAAVAEAGAKEEYLAHLQARLDAAAAEAGAKEEYLAHLQARLDAAAAEAGAKEEYLAHLQARLDAAAAEAGAKEEYLAHLQAQLDAAVAEAGAKGEHLARLQAQFEAAAAEAGAKEEHLARLQTRLEAAVENAREREDRLMVLRTHLNNAEAAQNMLEVDLDRAHAANTALESAWSRAQAEIANREAAVTEGREALSGREIELSHARTRLLAQEDQFRRDRTEFLAREAALNGQLKNRGEDLLAAQSALKFAVSGASAVERRLYETADALGAREAELDRAVASLQELEMSTTWRITRPVRRMLTNHRRMRGAIRRIVRFAARALRRSATSRAQKNQPTEDGPARQDREGVGSSSYVALTAQPPLEAPAAKVIAFYLPQFHPIPENDQWWGEGFTEWTNVRQGVPQFVGHYQPHVPDELGYYDLRRPDVQERQVELAKLYGISGFCFYFYWFSGKILLDIPINNYADNVNIDFPFCICWANENWSRRWDGLDSDVLISQLHSPEDDINFISHISRYLNNKNYIRIGSTPLIIVYRPSLLPNARLTARRWREWCRANGIGEIFLAYTQSFEAADPAVYGFDAAIEFPPNNSGPPEITDKIRRINVKYQGKVFDYRVFSERSANYKHPSYPFFRGVFPSWDNEVRRRGRGTVFLNSSPELFERWVTNAVKDAVVRFEDPDKRLVFVNAWNEWAEGAHLEPDQRYGYAWLQAIRTALARAKISARRVARIGRHRPSHRLAIIVHAYYLEILPELIRLFDEYDPNCEFIFTTSPDKKADLERKLAQFKHKYRIWAMENRGRDMAPFLEALARLKDSNFEYILKLHTKKSAHRADGDAWRNEMYRAIAAPKQVFAILDELDRRPDVGVVGPAKHVVPMTTYWGSNRDTVRRLSEKLGLGALDVKQLVFVAGTMFIARPEALEALMALGLSTADFEVEAGQTDGTLAHAVERLISVSAAAASLKVCGAAMAGRSAALIVERGVATYAYAKPTGLTSGRAR